MEVIEEMQRFVQKIANNEHETVKPGQSVRFTEACTDGDRIWQGDLALTIRTSVPKQYKLAEKPSVQLVVGNTEGSKHCLDSLDNVEIYLPPIWDEWSLKGPVLVIKKETTVLHPTHGNVTIPGGYRDWETDRKSTRLNSSH